MKQLTVGSRRFHPSPPALALLPALGLLSALGACSGEAIGPVPRMGAGMGMGPGGAGTPGVTPPGGMGSAPPPAGPGAACDPSRSSFAPARLWQLTDRQYVNVVRDVFGITLGEEDGKIVSAAVAERYSNYSESTAIDTQSAPNYQTAALRVADLAQPRLGELVGALAPTPAQMRAFIATRIARAWRRPLTDAEVAGLLQLYTDAQPDGAARGFHLVMQAALQAGSFLYRTELGTGAASARQPVQLTAHELAQALSFLFLESAPDEGLWARAQAGDLAEAAVLAGEVDRLLKLPVARANLAQKAAYWLGLAGIANRSRNSQLYPEWTESVKAGLAQSVELFVSDIVASGTLGDLLTSNKLYLNRELASLYGVAGVRGSALMPVLVPGPERSAGILSQPGFIVAASKLVDRADVVHRGLAINNALVCGGTIPPAPPEAGDEAKKMDGTERERAAARAMKPGCLVCHQKFDPLGLTFERYDALGRYSATRQAVLDSETGETTWQTGPVDASSVLVDDGLGGNLAGPIDGLPALAARLAAAGPRVGECASRKLAEYALGFNPAAESSCELEAVKQVFVSTGSFIELFRALALSPGFRTRNPVSAAPN
jgi:hypothetical protein